MSCFVCVFDFYDVSGLNLILALCANGKLNFIIIILQFTISSSHSYFHHPFEQNRILWNSFCYTIATTVDGPALRKILCSFNLSPVAPISRYRAVKPDTEGASHLRFSQRVIPGSPRDNFCRNDFQNSEYFMRLLMPLTNNAIEDSARTAESDDISSTTTCLNFVKSQITITRSCHHSIIIIIVDSF